MAELAKKENFLNITTQVQEQMLWCWAAVGTICALYFDPKSGWKQCTMATQSLVPKRKDCCVSTNGINPCNTTWFLLNDAHLGSFVTAKIDNSYQVNAISYTHVMQQIDNGLPVAYRIMNEFGMTHFLVVSGYDNTTGKRLVRINDSYYGDSELPYQELINNYNECQVTHTFFTKKPTT